MEWFRFITGTASIAAGLFFVISSVVGNLRFKFALNRMHSAALGDTLGLFFFVLGLCLYNGFDATCLKMLGIIALFWITSPVTSHLVMLMEISNGRYISETNAEASDEEGFENFSIGVRRAQMKQEREKSAKEEEK